LITFDLRAYLKSVRSYTKMTATPPTTSALGRFIDEIMHLVFFRNTLTVHLSNRAEQDRYNRNVTPRPTDMRISPTSTCQIISTDVYPAPKDFTDKLPPVLKQCMPTSRMYVEDCRPSHCWAQQDAGRPRSVRRRYMRESETHE